MNRYSRGCSNPSPYDVLRLVGQQRKQTKTIQFQPVNSTQALMILLNGGFLYRCYSSGARAHGRLGNIVHRVLGEE